MAMELFGRGCAGRGGRWLGFCREIFGVVEEIVAAAKKSVPQRLKPLAFAGFMAWLKPCPFEGGVFSNL